MGEFDQSYQDGLFGEKALSLSGWKCLQIESAAGTWYLVRDKGMAEKYARRPNGDNRAVFSRSEMHEANKLLEKLDDGSRQQWLGNMIDIKEVFEGAVIDHVEGNSS